MKKIVLIDDHDTFRAGLRQLIEKYSGFEVAGEGADARQGKKLSVLSSLMLQ